VLLEDAQKFIAGQTTVPSIAAVATEAANLQIALTKFDEIGAGQSMKRLSELLKPINGFEEFIKDRQAERQREYARQLAEARNKSAQNIFYIDSYVKSNLGDSKTTSLIRLRERIENSLKKPSIEEIDKANSALQAYLRENDLSDTIKTYLPARSSKRPVQTGGGASKVTDDLEQQIRRANPDLPGDNLKQPSPVIRDFVAPEPVITEMDHAVAANPNDVAALSKRGQLLVLRGNFLLAIKDFDEVIRLRPRDPEALNNRCWAHAILGDLQWALRDCTEAVKIRPQYAVQSKIMTGHCRSIRGKLRRFMDVG
jgi:tetratricopeptide (TPR) repeat protein